AEDILQTVYLKLLQSPIIFQSDEHEKAWLIRVCINLCKDMLKSSRIKKVSPLSDIDLTVGADDEAVDEPYPILSYVRNLSPKQKAAIYLHYYEDKSVAEIAKLMGTNQNTVLSWLRRGRENLKKSLKEEF
ncbi:MAG: sigma-70 family RNA polymerase sigma factor, partial [Oscillospiraceae bacterium]